MITLVPFMNETNLLFGYTPDVAYIVFWGVGI